MNTATLQVAIEVDDNGSVKIRRVGKEAEAAGKAAANAGRVGSKGFDSMRTSASMLSSIVSKLAVGLTALKLTDTARNAALMAARYETMGVVMQVVGNNAGYTGAQMEATSQKLQEYGIAMLEAEDVTTRLVQAQIDLSKATELARTAQDAAVIGNINSSEAFQRMVQGIQSAEVEILRTIGINVSFENAYKKLAAQLGKTANNLTEQEKMQARVNEVLLVGSRNAGVYEAAMGTAGKMVNSLKRYTDNLQVSLGEAFGPAVTHLVDELYGKLKEANKEVKDGQSTVQEWGKKFLSAVIAIEAEVIRLGMLIDKIGGSMTALVSSIADNHNVFGNLAADIDPKFQKFLSPENIGDTEVKKWADKWNKIYEERYNAGDKALQKLADREYQLLYSNKPTPRPDNLNPDSGNENGAGSGKGGGTSSAAQKKYQAIIDKLLPLEAAQRKYNESLAALDQMDPTHKTDRYKSALATLDREFETAKAQAESYAQKIRDAERATKESALTINGTKIDIAIAQGNMTEVEALPFRIDNLQKLLDLQREKLSEMQKSTPDEVNAWNSQREAIAQTTLQLAEYQQRLRLRDPYQAAKKGFEDYAESAINSGESIRQATEQAMSSMTDSLTNFVTTGKLEFSSLVNSIIADIARITIQQSITGPLAGMFGSFVGSFLPSAHGNVFSAPVLSAYSNTIVDTPTLFPFAKGVGLMGEDGSEAIMPLTRTKGGDLGVKALGASPNIQVNIIESAGKGGQQSQRTENGVNIIDILVDRVDAKLAQNAARGTGALTGVLEGFPYNLSRALGA